MLRTLLAAILLLVLTGCRAAGPRADAPESAADPRTFTLIDGHTCQPLRWNDLVTRAASAEAVLLGETHQPGPGQAVHGALFEDLLSEAPGAVAALEFFERDDQAHLDDFLAGLTDWPQLVSAALGRPVNEFRGHRDIIIASARAGRPVVAANAPRRYVSVARREGFDRLAALSHEQRRLFALPFTHPSDRYRADFFAAMDADPDDPDPDRIQAIDRSLRAQTLWDATMADSVAAAIERGARPALLVVGQFHTDFDGGLLQQLRARRPGTRTLTLCILSGQPDPAPDQPLPETLRGRADILIFAGAHPPAEP